MQPGVDPGPWLLDGHSFPARMLVQLPSAARSEWNILVQSQSIQSTLVEKAKNPEDLGFVYVGDHQ